MTTIEGHGWIPDYRWEFLANLTVDADLAGLGFGIGIGRIFHTMQENHRPLCIR